MRRTTLTALVLVALVGVLGIATSCGSAKDDPQGTNGDSGDGGDSGDSKDTGSSGGGTGGHTDATTGEKCVWPGWHRAPRLPPGCTGLCVPDDIDAVAPKIVWLDKASWCAGCKWLDVSQFPSGAVLDPGFDGAGPGLNSFILGVDDGNHSGTLYAFNARAEAVAAFRTNTQVLCGGLLGIRLREDGLGLTFVTNQHEPYGFVWRPAEAMGELMTTLDTSLLVTVKEAPNTFLSFSEERVAMGLQSRLLLGKLSDKTFVWADQLTGAPSGEMGQGVVVGSDVLVHEFDSSSRTSWWIQSGNSLVPYLGGPDLDIRTLGASGTDVVWTQGTQPSTQNGSVIFGEYDLYAATHTSDPSQLKPRLLVAGLKTKLGAIGVAEPRVANGYVSLVLMKQGPPLKTDALVVRLSDGHAWRSKLPEDFQWGVRAFTTSDRLWGAVAKTYITQSADTLAQVPYAAMEVVQTGFPKPDGG
jgi:hypothetical protein